MIYNARNDEKRRIAIVLISVLACLVWTLVQGQILYPILNKRCDASMDNLDGFFLLLPLATAYALSPKLRRLLPIRLTWSWVSLIPLCMLVFNLAFLANPDGIAIGFPMASLIVAGFATGLKEELFFRGFAFIRNGEPTPRNTVFLTTICFVLMHFLNLLRGDTILQVEFTVVLSFAYGLSFGMMRIVTGSIAWGVLIHGAVDATVSFVNNGSRTYQISAALFMLTTLVAAFIVFFTHPAMRKASHPKEGSANSIVDTAG